jgi:hypothetical protein
VACELDGLAGDNLDLPTVIGAQNVGWSRVG